MKKNIKQLLLTCIACLLTICVCISCNKSKNTNNKSAILNEVITDSINYADSISNNGLHAIVSVSADFPVKCDSILKKNIEEWMSEQLGGSYSGNINNGDSLIKYYSENQLNYYKGFSSEDASFISQCYWLCQFKKVYETDKIISFSFSQVDFTGGAHGGDFESGMTFRKEDGRRLDNSMFCIAKDQDLRNIIRDELKKQYFHVNNDTEFNESLLNDDDQYIFPLPVTPPLFLKDGVKFTYQQYEIVCYALGIPTCTIPYQELDSIMTVTAKNLITPQKQ